MPKPKTEEQKARQLVYNKEWAKNNRDKVNSYNRKWRASHPEEWDKCRKNYAKTHKEEIKRYHNMWRSQKRKKKLEDKIKTLDIIISAKGDPLAELYDEQ